MTKQEMAGYLASLISIMESKEDAGIPRGATLGREYSLVYNQLRGILEKEKTSETRSSKPGRESQARTDLEGGKPGRGEPIGESRGASESSGPTLPRSGLRGSEGGERSSS